MRSTLAAATLALAAIMTGPGFVQAAAAGSVPALQSPAETLPRPADEALRTGMTTLREMVAVRLQDDAAQAMTEADYVALAGEIERQVGSIVAGRDFHNPAGRHLQWLLGDITDGAGLMRSSPRIPGKRMGLLRVVETLNFYGREYDHPGWLALKP
ncbi:MAG TPA: hypothetical protein GX403_09995 [Rhodocyclaceae bacterium]|nr:hypothetical protein [Rhodocyclaceae bacterium]